jgi:hypothetical protein
MDPRPCNALVRYASPAFAPVNPRWRTASDLALATSVIATAVVAPLCLLSYGYALSIGLVAFAFAVAAIVGSSREQRERDARHDRRIADLLAAGISCKRFVELARLVESVSAATVRRYELEELLDRYVTVATVHDRARAALAMADRKDLECAYAASGPETARHQVCLARLHEAERCAVIEAKLADELATISDMISLVAQRDACPMLPPADDVVARCSLELEADAAAQRALWA